MNFKTVTWAMCVAFTTAALSWAQPYRIQQGNVLDANPQLGSAGLNSGGRQYDFNAGNRIVSGNVTGGQSFRGFSPIRDASSLSGFLPSDQLSNFRRDTFSLGDLQRGRTLTGGPLPYYSSTGTVTNTGAIIAGLNRSGTSQVQSPFMIPRAELRPQPVNPLSADANRPGMLLNVPTRLARFDTGQPITGQVNERLLNSPLFGGVRVVSEDALAAQADREKTLGAPGRPLDTRMDTRVNSQPMDLRMAMTSERTDVVAKVGSPMDRLIATTPQPTNEQLKAAQAGAKAAGSAAQPPTQGVRGISEPGIVSTAGAGDVYAAMRTAAAQLLKPLESPSAAAARARTEAQEKTRGPSVQQPLKPATAGQRPTPQPPAQAGGPTFTERMTTAAKVLSEPVKTFVGTEQSVTNQYLAASEAALRAGNYYKAADLYELARAVDPRNPLPLLGQSMALLAAGEYVSSVTHLLQASQQFDSLAHFPIDLKSFIPDVAALDRRRADLEQRLEVYDDYRLRFLLGYAEYFSGMEKPGLVNMKKAGDAAPREWEPIRRFVKLLDERQIPAKK